MRVIGYLALVASNLSCVNTSERKISDTLQALRMPFQVLETEHAYIGTAALQARDRYRFVFMPRNEPKQLIVWTCAGPEFFENPVKAPGWEYVPTSNLERTGFCPIQVISVGKNGIKERAFIGINNGDKLKARVECSRRAHEALGQFVCDHPANNTYGHVQFSEPALFEPAPGCTGIPETPTAMKSYEIKAMPGVCTYTFKGTISGEFFIFVMRGYKP